MKIRDRLQRYWQIHSGEEDTPFDGDTPAWLISLVVHMALLVMLTIFLRELPDEDGHVELVTAIIEPDTEIPEDFFFSQLDKVEIGANSIDSTDMADAVAELEEEVTELVSKEEVIEKLDLGMEAIVPESIVDEDIAFDFDPNIRVQGAAGEGTTGAAGAIDRITQEIIDSLEYRKTLVVWIFDRSVSLSAQRQAVHNRLARIYEELGVIEASGDPRFAKHHDKPLLSSVMAFGQDISIRTKMPTDQLSEIKSALMGIQNDASGTENVFRAVYQAAEEHKKYALSKDRRSVMLVLFTDEAGDDAAQMLDKAVESCRRKSMPVFVVGVPAPFGRKAVEIKWVDPNPAFDQSPQWTTVRQGPESLYPERLRLAFSGQFRHEEPLDSGFGPFALTRLAVETSGIYFSVHANRDLGRPARKSETAHLSAYIKHFFDQDVMQRYRPDYVSAGEYMRILRKNKAKMALVEAANMSWVQPMGNPRTNFPRRSEAALINLLSEAQQQSAKILAGTLVNVCATLERGERDRDKIVRPRWQAGYDLAMGRALATKIRTYGYNLMLAQARRGMKFKNPKNDTWILKPSDKIMSGSSMEKQAEKAEKYLQRVVDDHAGTPWAMIAKQELADKMGWTWTEAFRNVNPPPRPPTPGNNNPPPRRDDRKQQIQRKTKRPPPKL